MPVQGSLRDLSVVETLQLVGSQRKSVSVRFTADDEEVVLHFRDGLLIAARVTQGVRREPFVDALVALGHLSPNAALPIAAQILEEGREPWVVLRDVPHLDRETCGRVFHDVTSALLDRIVLWDHGHFAILPASPVEPVFTPGLSLDNLLLEAMRRLDEVAAWKHGEFPPSAIPYFAMEEKTIVTTDPLRRAVLRQIDGRRTIQQIVDATRLGEYESYHTITEGVQEGAIQILNRPIPPGVPAPAREVLRRSPALAVLMLILLLVATSAWVDRRLAVDHGPWQEARAQWEEIDICRLLDAHRYRTGSYPRDLNDLRQAGNGASNGAGDRWFYYPDGDSYRLIRR